MSTTSTRLRQIPIAMSASLDSVLEEHRSSLQKFRQHFRQHFKISPRLGEVSVGRYGKIFLESTAVLPCLQTALRWSRKEADVLCSAYHDAGLSRLIASSEYKQMAALTAGAVQEAVRQQPNKVDFAVLVSATVSDLVRREPILLEVANQMERISEMVDQKLTQLRRYPGQLVRVEGDLALITIERNGKEELRSVDARLLRSVGISANGDAFFLNELHWSPETVSYSYVPAVAIEDEADFIGEELAAALTAAQKPLFFPARGGTRAHRTSQMAAAAGRAPGKSRR